MGIVGAMAAVAFDYCLTISQEVQLIWGKKWDAMRITFTLARYATLMGTAMTTYAAVTDRSKYKSCATFGDVSYASHLISIIAAEGLLIFRTYAFWNQNKKLLMFLLALAAFSILGAVGTSKIASFYFVSPPSCEFRTGKGSAVQYIFLIIYELVLIVLTLYKRFSFYKGTRSRLVSTLYRDGIIYMTCVIMASIANIFIALVVPGDSDYTNIMDVFVPQLVVHGVLASRILFNLRQSRQSDSVIIDEMFPLANMPRTPDAGETTIGGSTFVTTHEDFGAKDSYE
ncbi:uncharacterized protein BJ212DRAFT_1482456 [Suillus subaureus]|uniref:DUF6533 domain-containing protein n=1 Tax=Suillus subaureus TaxID=48587 RepID=A0A9P7E866_9AGAM|nr:uncharacterized protein BJ212DRAFT_1482456 [Suillus subaureus]KAG1813556.1 hypothetical protein BJ212DRAFT_1482456 [Suillus subaureus]